MPASGRWLTEGGSMGALRAIVGTAVAAAIGLTVAAGQLVPVAVAATTVNLYVNPVQGSDAATGTETAPLRTIQQAMDRARPGTAIHLAAGTYKENVVTTHSGLANERIIVEGPASGTATLFGTTHVMAIENSYYTLQYFAIDGQEQVEGQYPVSTWPTQISQVGNFKASVTKLVKNDRLIYIDSLSGSSGVTGTILDHMTLTGAGGECVRIRDNASGNIVENSTIRYCGMYPQPAVGSFTYHNGEGVYIGTSPKSTGLSGFQDDQSNSNVVTNDTITTYGSECLDVKENSHNNILRNSFCADNTEPGQDKGSNVELRGYANTVDANQITNSAGYGLKIASDTAVEDLGRNNIMWNIFTDQPSGALYDTSHAPLGKVCGNVVGSGSTLGNFSGHPAWLSAC